MYSKICKLPFPFEVELIHPGFMLEWICQRLPDLCYEGIWKCLEEYQTAYYVNNFLPGQGGWGNPSRLVIQAAAGGCLQYTFFQAEGCYNILPGWRVATIQAGGLLQYTSRLEGCYNILSSMLGTCYTTLWYLDLSFT